MKLISKQAKSVTATSKQIVTNQKRLAPVSSWAHAISQKASFVGNKSLKRPISSISSILDKYEETSSFEKNSNQRTRLRAQSQQFKVQTNRSNAKYYKNGYIDSPRSKKQKIDKKVNKQQDKKIDGTTKYRLIASGKQLDDSGTTKKLSGLQNQTRNQNESKKVQQQTLECNKQVEKSVCGKQHTATNDIPNSFKESKYLGKHAIEYQTCERDNGINISKKSLTLNLKQKNQQRKSLRFFPSNQYGRNKVFSKNKLSNEIEGFLKINSMEKRKDANTSAEGTKIIDTDLNLSKDISIVKQSNSKTELTNELATQNIIDQTTTTQSTTTSNPYSLSSNTSQSYSFKKKVNKNRMNSRYNENDNFSRLNMRNKSGACKGTRIGKKKSSFNKLKSGVTQSVSNSSNEIKSMSSLDHETEKSNYTSNPKAYLGITQNCNTLIDPVDDYLDGTYHNQKENTIDSLSKTQLSRKRKENKTKHSLVQKETIGVPKCARHQRPCIMRTVKTNRSGNRNRKFYTCSLPYGEKCNHFEWVEDTVSSVCSAILKSGDYSSFISRQVSMYAERFRSLTLPELRQEAKKRGIKNHAGKKEQVITRLLLWVRDEVMKTDDLHGKGKANESQASNEEIREGSASPDSTINEQDVAKISNDHENIVGSKITSSDDDEKLNSEDELEFVSDGRQDTIDNNQNNDLLYRSLYRFYGYRSFRGGQEWAIRRCLAGKRTLLVAPTGMGKSLCYILPAGLMKGLTIVVSPLISLMEDQLRQIPPCIPAAVLSGSLSKTKQATVIDDVLKKRLKILFLSPERLVSAAFQRLLRPKYNQSTNSYERMLPKISLLCVDEVHCVSQWGHTFRPAYLRLKSLLPLLKPQSLLALTATAGAAVIADICKNLGIKEHVKEFHEKESLVVKDSQTHNDECVKVLDLSRDNIEVMSTLLKSDTERRDKLRKMLRERPKTLNEDECVANKPKLDGILSSGSVIVYVWRQRDAEVIAEQLLMDGVTGGVVFYHGGMDAGTRARAQSKFMRGKARVCVATVAFGLGINKSDIEGIIHVCLPPSLEHFVQEIGRAGRDGRNAKAISLITPEDVQSRLSLAHSDRITHCQLRTLMLFVKEEVEKQILDHSTSIQPLSCNENESFPSALDLALPISLLTNSVDCKAETLESIFSLMEDEAFFKSPILNVKGVFYDKATITLKRRDLSKLSKEEPLAQAIENCGIRLDTGNMISSTNQMKQNQAADGGTASQLGFHAYSFGTYQISILRCTRYLGRYAEPRHVFAALRRLQNDGELEIALDTSFNGKYLHLRLLQEGIDVFGSQSKEEKEVLHSENIQMPSEKSENVIRILSAHLSEQEKTRVNKVKIIYNILSQISCLSFGGFLPAKTLSSSSTVNKNMCNELCRKDLFNQFVKQYFSETNDNAERMNETLCPDKEGNEHIRIHDIPPSFVSEISLDDFSDIAQLTNDVMTLLSQSSLTHTDQNPIQVKFGSQEFIEYTARSIVKILHGIDSPRAKTKNWYSHPTWSKWRTTSFASLNKAILHILHGTSSTN